MAIRIYFVLLAISLVIKESSSQQNILNTTVIKDGQPFSMTCNIGTVGVSSSNVKLVMRLAILRQLPGDSQYTQLAQYLSYGPPNGKETQTMPAGRRWNVTFTGAGDGITSNPNMMISISVPDARCSDAGMYKCEMEYFDLQNQLVTGTQNTQNVSSQAVVKNIIFSWSPDNSLPSSPYYSEFYEGDNITITCRVDGPRDLTLGWRVGRVPNYGGDRIFTDYSYASDITTQPPTLIPGSTCESYRHVTSLRMTINSYDHNDVMYLCEVRENGMVLMSSNMTTGLFGTNQSSTSHASSNTYQVTSPTLPLLSLINGQLVVSCEAGVTGLPQNHNDILAIEIGRWSSVDSSYNIIALYRTFGRAMNREAKNIPAHLKNNWGICMSGAGDGMNNRLSMRVVWTLSEVTVEDSGTYYCSVLSRWFPDQTPTLFEFSQIFNGTGVYSNPLP